MLQLWIGYPFDNKFGYRLACISIEFLEWIRIRYSMIRSISDPFDMSTLKYFFENGKFKFCTSCTTISLNGNREGWFKDYVPSLRLGICSYFVILESFSSCTSNHLVVDSMILPKTHASINLLILIIPKKID